MMKKNWKPALSLLTVTALLFGQGAATTHAQGSTVPSSPSPVYTFTSLASQGNANYAANGPDQTPGAVLHFLSEPVTLSGVNESFDYYYSVPRATIGSNSYLDITFYHSELLNAAHSTLTVSVDDKPMKSVFLTKETAQQGKIRIPLGAAQTAYGFHKITISKHSLLTDNMCVDQHDPANWLKVDKSSFIFLDTQGQAASADLLREYPQPFVEPGNSTEVYTRIVVPDAAQPDVIAAALKVASSLSAQTATQRPIPIVPESEWMAKAELDHAIAIGNPEAWKGPLKKLVADEGIAKREQKLGLDYYQMRVNQSASAKLLLLVSGGKDTSFAETIYLLTDPEMNKQLAGNQLVVKQTPGQAAAEAMSTKLTLASAGYSSVMLEHGNSRNQQVVLTIPAHWKLTGDVSLELNMKISPLLMQKEGEDQPQHQLTVTVNGVPHTFLLHQLKPVDKNDGYQVRVPISAAVLQEANRTLTIGFSASMDLEEAGCAAQTGQGRWVFVDKESVLHVPHEVPVQNSFRYWPAPFVQEDGMKNTAFLLPEKRTSAYLTQLAMLQNEMVKETRKQGNDFAVFSEPLTDQDRQAISAYHVVVLGDIEQYPSLKQVQEQLLINDSKPLTTYPIINETTRYVAWIQPSVWNPQRSMSFFQAAEMSKAIQSGDLHADLLQFMKNTQADGQIVVMSKSNEVFAVQVEEQAGKGTSLDEVAGNIPIWLIVGVLAVFLLLLVIFIRMLSAEKKKAKRKG